MGEVAAAWKQFCADGGKPPPYPQTLLGGWLHQDAGDYAVEIAGPEALPWGVK